MGDHWPWEVRELDPRELEGKCLLITQDSIWLLKTSIIGNYCISLHGKQFSTLVGEPNLSRTEVLQ
jgi:hypothetical protein